MRAGQLWLRPFFIPSGSRWQPDLNALYIIKLWTSHIIHLSEALPKLTEGNLRTINHNSRLFCAALSVCFSPVLSAEISLLSELSFNFSGKTKHNATNSKSSISHQRVIECNHKNSAAVGLFHIEMHFRNISTTVSLKETRS